MFAAIIAALKAFPIFVEGLKELAAAIKAQADAYADKRLLEKYKAASAKAIATKDTSDLESVFQGGGQ